MPIDPETCRMLAPNRRSGTLQQERAAFRELRSATPRTAADLAVDAVSDRLLAAIATAQPVEQPRTEARPAVVVRAALEPSHTVLLA